MGFGRVAATCVSVACVAGCALLVAGMSSAGFGTGATDTPLALPTMRLSYTGQSWAGSASALATSSVAPTSSSASASSTASPSTTSTTPPRSSAATHAAPAPAARTTTASKTGSPAPPALVRGQALPVAGTTTGATRVITVVAASYSSTTATLQAWDRAPGGGWLKHGGAILAHVGSQGLTTSPSESKSATPIGSFTLTQAFGALGNPGTGLPYFRTTSADWWISQPGSLYNTHQHCSGGCTFDTMDSSSNPNEHLVTVVPYYNYAVVIDYNTRNSPTGVQAGKGSAFFLHVTDGTPTAGCVAIPQSNLVAIMAWLTPSARPRILIGVNG